MEKKRTWHYRIVDCEHEGDVRDAEDAVMDAGGEIVDVYWDGNDCGEAYVEFAIPDGRDVQSVLKALGIRY